MPQYSLAVEMGSYYRKDVLRRLLAERKVKKSEQDTLDEIDQMHVRSELNANHSDEGFLVRQRPFESAPTDGAGRLSGDSVLDDGGREQVPEIDYPRRLTRMPRSGVNNTDWCRHAAATYIQKAWRRTRT